MSASHDLPEPHQEQGWGMHADLYGLYLAYPERGVARAWSSSKETEKHITTEEKRGRAAHTRKKRYMIERLIRC